MDILSVNWTVQPLSGEQLLVLRNVAALHLQKEGRSSTFDFTHELCEGRMTCKSKGLFVSFVGTFFHADLGLVRGERWTIDFLLPTRSERIRVDESSIVFVHKTAPSGRIDGCEVRKDLAATTEASLLD